MPAFDQINADEAKQGTTPEGEHLGRNVLIVFGLLTATITISSILASWIPGR